MARLFGNNKLKTLASTVDTESILPFIEHVRNWQADYYTGTLRTDNETAREQAYNQTFFKQILGYSEKPTDPYFFQPKASTEQRGIPDATIGHFETESNHKNYSAVVELKGAGINLDRPQRGEGNLSAVQQGFKYKTMHRSVPFVIVSNFWEFRLYNDNQLDYEAWTLDDLANPEDDYFSFKTWYVLLHKKQPHGCTRRKPN